VCLGAIDVDVVHHQVHLDVELAPASVSAAGTLTLKARSRAEAIWLDAQALEILSVGDLDDALTFEIQADKLCVRLQRPIEPGELFNLQLRWRVPVSSPGLHVYPDQIWAAYNTPAWMPTRQDPAQRATLTLTVRAPAGFQVHATGHLPLMRPLPTDVHAFQLERPSAPFLYAFVVGRFEVAQVSLPGVSVQALGPPGRDLTSALEAAAGAGRYLYEHLARHTPGYTQVFVHGDVAQEAAGMALISDSYLQALDRDPSDDWVFTHELAHQVFGWHVPCADFADSWLNEGFATFLVGALKEARQGRAAYDAEVTRWRVRSADAHAKGHDAPVALSRPGEVVAPPAEGQLQARGVTYFRGALVLHRLRQQLGDDVFWLGLRRYVNNGIGRSVRTEDLRAALEAESRKDLGPFFQRWVYTVASDL
jgi:aminopeptidase N